VTVNDTSKKTGDLEMSLASITSISRKADTSETFDVLGPHIQFLTALSDADDSYCVIGGTFPAGVIVPIHSHGDRETFHILDGTLQALWEDRWVTLTGGDVFDVPGNTKHAFRNASDASVSLVFVTTMRMGRFFRDIGRPAATVLPGPPKPEDLGAFFAIAQRYGYWLGGPADNAAVGLSFG
jgi:quercetin dioxygenase-like cupin family protein